VADPEAVAGDELVACKADDAGGGDPAGQVDRLRVYEPVDGLPGSDAGG
jgi:hypothetical protein